MSTFALQHQRELSLEFHCGKACGMPMCPYPPPTVKMACFIFMDMFRLSSLNGALQILHGSVTLNLPRHYSGLHLKETATEIEGTFRINGSARRMRDLQAAFESPPKVRLNYSRRPNIRRLTSLFHAHSTERTLTGRIRFILLMTSPVYCEDTSPKCL